MGGKGRRDNDKGQLEPPLPEPGEAAWRRELRRAGLTDRFAFVGAGGERVVIRRGYEAEAERLGLLGGKPVAAAQVSGGRIRHPLVDLADGQRALVRAYRRGGLLSRFNPRLYFMGNRAMEEVRVTELAAERGVRVPTVIGAAEFPARRVGYTAALALVWLEGARDLAAWLATATPAARVQALHAAGLEVARLHAAAIGHPDLNLRNLLVANEPGPAVYIIDFDRARVYPGGVPPWRRRRDLLRLARSARKLRAPLGEPEWTQFRAGYGPEWPLTGLPA